MVVILHYSVELIIFSCDKGFYYDKIYFQVKFICFHLLTMEEELACSICLEVAENAVETSCCHHIFCEKCLRRVLERECPQCSKYFDILVSHVARRIIGNMPATCSFNECGMVLTRSNVKEHEQLCTYRVYVCSSPNCSFRGEKKEYLSHLFKEHEDDIFVHAHLCFSQPGFRFNSQDRIATKTNAVDRVARIGQTGKYYCSGALEIYCNCCDGNCGPSNGCNCKACMKLDIESRNLPKNYFVNREGAICRKSDVTGIFYCGRVTTGRLEDDGYCGPDDGESCRACEIIQDQINTRYDGIW